MGGTHPHDQDGVDAELRLVAALRASIRDKGGDPSSAEITALLDELATLIRTRRSEAT